MKVGKLQPSGRDGEPLARLSLACGTLKAQNAWVKADGDTRRLPPSMFARLPRPVRADLERRGCTVPQVWYDSVPGNVITGHFRTPAQTDWAALCSVHRVSTILVYWKGRADSVDELGSAPDKDYLQDVGGGRIGYSRAVAAAAARTILQDYRSYGGTEPPSLNHQGIEDAV